MIHLLLAIIVSGSPSFGGLNGFLVGKRTVSSEFLTTTCSTRTQAAWDEFSWQSDPIEVTAANTAAGGGCLADSISYPTPSLP